MKRSDRAIEFDLNEKLYFEKGQEIDEMLSISLDPDIAVQPYDDYIQIRGIVLLQGEYKRVINTEEESSEDKREFTRLIEKVYELDDVRARFSHRFPVEIQVPPYLVENLDDIHVTVSAFDYELPDQNTLKINASIHIDGIVNEMEPEQKETKKATAEVIDFEKSESKSDDSEGKLKDSLKEVEPSTEEEMKEEVLEDQQEQKNEEEERPLKEAMLQGAEEDAAVTDREQLLLFDEEASESTEIDIQLSESASEENEEVKDVLFLTDLFGGNEEESYTKLRIYITQEDDTIESIAKRYGISALQLMKENEISSESLEAGQLLYLPVKQEQD